MKYKRWNFDWAMFVLPTHTHIPAHIPADYLLAILKYRMYDSLVGNYAIAIAEVCAMAREHDLLPTSLLACYNSLFSSILLASPAVLIKPTARETTGADYLAIQIILAERASAYLSLSLSLSPLAFSLSLSFVFLVLSSEFPLACAGVVLHVPLMCARERRITHTHTYTRVHSFVHGVCIRYQPIETVLLISVFVETGCITLSHRRRKFSLASPKYLS